MYLLYIFYYVHMCVLVSVFTCVHTVCACQYGFVRCLCVHVNLILSLTCVSDEEDSLQHV